MQHKVTLLATTALAALALTAPAQAASGWYASVSGGANWLNDNDFVAVSGADTLTFGSESDTGWYVGAALGLSLNQYLQGLRVEAELAFRENSVDGLWTSDNGPTIDSGTLDFDHSTLSVMANVWYDFNIAGVKPYVGGGVGWADTDLDGDYLGGTFGGTDKPVINYSDNGFAWQLGGGVNFEVAPSVALGFGYRYFNGPEVTILAPDVANVIAHDLDSENHVGLVTLTFGM